MKDIKVNVSLGNKDALKSEIEGLGKNTEIKIDLTETNKSLRDLINTIASLNSKLNDIDFSKLTGLGNSAKGATKDIKETANVLERMSGKETKVTITTNSKGAKTEVTEFGEAFAKTSKQIEVNGEIIKQSTTTNFKKAEDTFADFSKRISELGSKGADISKLSQDFNRLSSLKTDAPEREIKELGTAISELEKKFKTLNDFQFKQNLNIDANLFSGKIDSTQAEKLRDTLNSITVDNLNKGMATFQSEMKMAVSETSKMKVEMTAFKKNEEVLLSFTQRLSDLYDKGVNIDKLETQFNKLNTLRTDASEQEIKDLDKAIKELENSCKTLESFNARMNASLKTNLLSGKIDLSDYEKLKNTLNSITVDNLTKGMANFNSELALAKNRTTEVKSQISTLESSIAKMQSALQSAQNIATKSGNNAILNSSEYKNVNDQLQITEQYLEQVKNTGKTISLEALNKSVSSATNAVGQLNNKTKETQSGLKSVENALASMQVKLNNMKSTKLMDEGVINRLQTGLNNLATCTDKNSSAFKSYINEFNKTKEAEKQVKQLQQALDKLQDAQKKAIIAEKIDTSQYSAVKNSINEIEQALNKVKTTGQTVDISGTMNRAKSSVDNLRSSLQGATTDGTNFGNAITTSLSRMGIYVSVATAIRAVWNEFKEGIQYVKEVDALMADFATTMTSEDFGREQIVELKNEIQDLSIDLGINSTEMLKVASVASVLGDTIEDVKAKTKSSAILSNLSGIDGGEIAKGMLALTNQYKEFDITTGNADKKMMNIADKIIAVAKNLNVDFNDAVGGALESVKVLGSVAEQVGMTFDETLAFSSAIVESTGQSFNEVSTGLKTIISRTMRVGDATGEEALKAEKALNAVGIAIKNTDGTMRPFMSIMGDLSNKWVTLTEVEQQYVADAMGGARQLNYVLAGVQNLDKANELLQYSLTASGDAMEAQNNYAQSLEGKLNTLSSTADKCWESLINSDTLKGGVDILTGLISTVQEVIDTFGALPVIGLVVAGVFSSLISKVYAVVKAKGALTVATELLNATMASNPVLLLVGALGLLAVATTKVVKYFKEMKSSLEELNEASETFKENNENIDVSEDNLLKYKNINDYLSQGNLTLEEREELEQQLVTVEGEIGSAISGSDAIMSNSLLTVEEKISLIKQLIEEQKKANAQELNDGLRTQDYYDKINKKMKEQVENYKALRDAMNDPNLDSETRNAYARQMEDLSVTIQDAWKEIQIYNGVIEDSDGYLEAFGRRELEVDDDTRELIGTIYEVGDASDEASNGIDGTADSLGELSDKADETKNAVDGMFDGVSDWNVDGVIDEVDQGFQSIVDEAESVMDAIDKLTDKFDEHKNGIELANTAIEEFNENGYLTGDTWDDIVSSGDMDLIAGLWLEAGQAKEYYKNLSEGWQQEREDTANAEIMLSALEKGLIEENSEAYQIAKQAEIDASNRAKAEKIAILDQEKNEAIAIETIKINEKYNKMLEDANNSYEVEMIKLEQQRAIAEARQGIEEQYSTDRQAIEEAQTEGVIAEYERQKQANQDKCDDISFKEQQLQTEFEKTTEAKKTAENGFVTNSQTNMTSYVTTANSAYRKDASNFASSITTKMSSLSRFKGALAGAVTAVNNFNNMAIRTPNFNTGGGSSGGGTGSKRSAINESEFSPVAPMSADSEGTVTPMSAEGGSSEGGNGGTAPIEPFAIPGGTQHGASSASGSTVGSTSGKITQLAGSIDSLTSSVKNLTSATKSNTSATKSSNSETEKEIKNIEIELDRYYKYNDVLEDYENILKEIEDAKENANKSVYLNLQKQELALYGKKIEVLRQLEAEQQRELNESKNILMSNGFLIDSYGNLINSQERLQDLVNQANNSSNDVKEANQDHVKYLEEIVDLYTKLANDSIPDTIDKIRDLQNEINSTAIDQLTDLRKKLVDGIKEERELQKQSEIDILDSRIEELKRQIKELEDDDADLYSKKARLEAEIAKWQKDDSGMGIKKVKELQEQLDELNKDIRKEELNKQIEEIESTKDSISDTYDKMLEDKEIYEEANRLITDKNQTEILRLLQTYEDDYTDIGRLWGSSLSQAFMDEISVAFEALDYLKGENNKFTSGTTANTPVSTSPPKANPTPTPAPTTPTNSGSSNVGKGSRVKITDPNAGIYVNSTTGNSSGTWKGAGFGTGDTLYVVNVSGNRMALSRTQSINDAIGWIDKTKLMAFATGGYTGEFNGGRLAMLHEKEYVLNSAQTQAWLKLVPMLTELVKTPFLDMAKIFEGLTNSTVDNSSEVTITNNIEINNSSNVDMDKTNKGIEQLFKEQLRKYGKIKK